MATVNHSRGARLSRRFGADRPRTHPKRAHSPADGELPSQQRPVSPAIPHQDRSKRGRRVSVKDRHSIDSKGKSPELPTDAALIEILYHVRLHLDVVRAAATVCAMALKSQNAENDYDISVVLRRSVADAIDRQIERMNAAVKGNRVVPAAWRRAAARAMLGGGVPVICRGG